MCCHHWFVNEANIHSGTAAHCVRNWEDRDTWPVHRDTCKAGTIRDWWIRAALWGLESKGTEYDLGQDGLPQKPSSRSLLCFGILFVRKYIHYTSQLCVICRSDKQSISCFIYKYVVFLQVTVKYHTRQDGGQGSLAFHYQARQSDRDQVIISFLIISF